MHHGEYAASLQPTLEQHTRTQESRRKNIENVIATLNRRKYLAITASAAERSFAFRFHIDPPPTSPQLSNSRLEFEAAIARMLEAVWETVQTGVEPAAEITSTLFEMSDEQWFSEGSLISPMDPWAQTFDEMRPRWPTRFAELMHYGATVDVPHSVHDGRRAWRESTFGEVDDSYDLERFGPPYLLHEQNILMATSPLAPIPLDWVIRDVEYAESVADPTDLLVLRGRAKTDTTEFAKWRLMLLNVDFQQHGPLTADETWPKSAHTMINDLQQEHDSSFPTD